MSSSRTAIAATAIALCVAMSGAVLAQDAHEYDHDQQAPVAAKIAPPFKGEVTCDKLKVRAFPKQDDDKFVTAIIKKGHEVNVLGEEGDWYAIEPTAETGNCYIWSHNVERDTNGDAATVTADNAPVRFDTRMNAEKMTELAKGTKIEIVAALHGNTWFEIKPPAGVKYYVSKKHIKRSGEFKPAAGTPAVATPAPKDLDAESRDLIAKAEKEAAEQMETPSPDLSNASTLAKRAEGSAHDADVKEYAHSLVANYTMFQAIIDKFRGDATRMTLEITKFKNDWAKTEANRNKPRVYIRQGYLEMVGYLPDRPGDWRLITPEGTTICYVKFPADEEAAAGVRRQIEGHYRHWMAVSGTVLPAEMQFDGKDVVVIDGAWERTAPRDLKSND